MGPKESSKKELLFVFFLLLDVDLLEGCISMRGYFLR